MNYCTDEDGFIEILYLDKLLNVIPKDVLNDCNNKQRVYVKTKDTIVYELYLLINNIPCKKNPPKIFKKNIFQSYVIFHMYKLGRYTRLRKCKTIERKLKNKIELVMEDPISEDLIDLFTYYHKGIIVDDYLKNMFALFIRQNNIEKYITECITNASPSAIIKFVYFYFNVLRCFTFDVTTMELVSVMHESIKQAQLFRHPEEMNTLLAYYNSICTMYLIPTIFYPNFKKYGRDNRLYFNEFVQYIIKTLSFHITLDNMLIYFQWYASFRTNYDIYESLQLMERSNIRFCNDNYMKYPTKKILLNGLTDDSISFFKKKVYKGALTDHQKYMMRSLVNYQQYVGVNDGTGHALLKMCNYGSSSIPLSNKQKVIDTYGKNALVLLLFNYITIEERNIIKQYKKKDKFNNFEDFFINELIIQKSIFL
jgi:hypothetical protein